MVDKCRADVNKYGFCRRHFKQLYKGENKLGLALQTDTRLNFLKSKLKVASNYKDAVKMAENIKKELQSCLICNLIEFNMSRYFDTIPMMYKNEEEFKKLFKQNKGFCLNHYQRLLSSSKHANSALKEYLTDLTTLQNENLNRLEKELLFFTEKFDYKNSSKSWGTSEDALKRSINKLCGDIIEK